MQSCLKYKRGEKNSNSNRVTTCLDNLEMSMNLTAVMEMLGIFTKSRGNVKEKILSGKSGLKLFIVSCIFASIQVFSST